MNQDLKKIAQSVRNDILSMSYNAQSAHMGGALSVVEILVALYFDVMNVNIKNSLDPARDRLVLSKAHDAKALYSVLARRGFFDIKVLDGYEKDGGKLPGHSTRHCVPGVETSAGALGHGLSMAAGMAWALKFKNKNEKCKVYAVLSDGECDEGSVWEAALFAGHHSLSNLTVIVDYNKLQGFGKISDVLNLEPIADKWKAFGFEVSEVDGHDFKKLIPVLKKQYKKPHCIIAHTIKGLGGPSQHIGKISSQYKPPTQEEYENYIR